MVSVPSFLLRKLYVKGSLKNTEKGFQFQLRNSLGSGYAHKMMALEVDDRILDITNCFFWQNEKRQCFDQVSTSNTFTLAMNSDITIQVDNLELDSNPHKITMAFDVPGLGNLKFNFTDQTSEG
ncbi:MAG: hypothetical protein VX355_01085 [Chloroflexota bacterium]